MSGQGKAMSLQPLLTQLKIVACVPRHGRLGIGTGDALMIESDVPYLTGVRRWMRGDGRVRVLRTLTALAEAAAEKVADLADSRWLDEGPLHAASTRGDDRRAQVRRDLERLAADVANAVGGVEQLRESTYARDMVTTSELEVLQDRLLTIAQRARDALSQG